MTYEEFVEKYGEKVWNELVLPRKSNLFPSSFRANANVIVDGRIQSHLESLGLSGFDLDEARLRFIVNTENGQEVWDKSLREYRIFPDGETLRMDISERWIKTRELEKVYDLKPESCLVEGMDAIYTPSKRERHS